ncbi:MAG: terminase small subunit [bacterium]
MPPIRLPKYKTLKELQDKIDEYFMFCDNRIQHVYSPKAESVIEVIDPAPYTMSGLARSMGIDRDTLNNYSHREAYFGAIKAARERVHEDVETRLMEKQATGAIFNLTNNFGWRDMRNVDHTTDGEKIEPMIIYMPEEYKSAQSITDKFNDNKTS